MNEEEKKLILDYFNTKPPIIFPTNNEQPLKTKDLLYLIENGTLEKIKKLFASIENIEKLTCLCQECHNKHHNIKETINE